MDLIRTFSFYKDNYDIHQKFDKRISSYKKVLFILIFKFFHYTYLSSILKNIVLKYYLDRLQHTQAEIVFFVFGKNHKSVHKEMVNNGLDFYAYDFDQDDINYTDKINKIPKRLILYAALGNAKQFLKAYNQSKKDVKLQGSFLRIVKLSGYEIIFKKLLKNHNTIIKFNDHNMYHMLLFDICTELKKKTVYIQHAPVSYRFPKLHHDLNVLFSEDSIEKYKKKGIKKKVFLFLDIRMLPGLSLSKTKNNNKKTILIAFNLLDSIIMLENLVNSLYQDFNLILRPHPSDKRIFLNFTKKNKSVISKNESIWKDLETVDIVISNESAVALEAIFANKLFYKAAMLSEPIDNYGFLQKGLITKEFLEINRLKHAIKNREVCFNKEKLNYFVGNYQKQKSLFKNLKNEILHI